MNPRESGEARQESRMQQVNIDVCRVGKQGRPATSSTSVLEEDSISTSWSMWASSPIDLPTSLHASPTRTSPLRPSMSSPLGDGMPSRRGVEKNNNSSATTRLLVETLQNCLKSLPQSLSNMSPARGYGALGIERALQQLHVNMQAGVPGRIVVTAVWPHENAMKRAMSAPTTSMESWWSDNKNSRAVNMSSPRNDHSSFGLPTFSMFIGNALTNAIFSAASGTSTTSPGFARLDSADGQLAHEEQDFSSATWRSSCGCRLRIKPPPNQCTSDLIA